MMQVKFDITIAEHTDPENIPCGILYIEATVTIESSLNAINKIIEAIRDNLDMEIRE